MLHSVEATDEGRPPVWPTVALIAGVISMGTSAIFVRWADAPGAVNGFYRMSIAVVLLGLPFFFEVRRTTSSNWRAGVLWSVLAGLSFAGDLVFWNESVRMTSAANATFLGNTASLWVGLGALWLFRQRLKSAYWLGLMIALSGAGSLVAGDFNQGAEVGQGSLYALVAGVFYAGYFLATQRARESIPSLTSWWLSALASMLGLLAAALLLGQPLTGYRPDQYVAMFAIGLFTQIGGYLLVNYALGHIPAPIVSTTALLQPVCTLLFAIPLLGEIPTPLEIAGCLLLLTGVFVVNRYK
jgi:drug/metabolite transporter (DMT)-like permease